MATIQKKVCLLGDFAVGKTSLVRRYVEGRFDDKYLSTIGVKISRRTLEVGSDTLNMLLWDLAGGDEFSTVESGYLRGAAGALVVCDLTRRETITSYQRYSQQLRAANPSAVIAFLANKVDLTLERVVSDADLDAICVHLDGPCYLTSAKSGQGVEAAFAHLGQMLLS
jgi:small GTP-binding protein